MCVLWGGGGVRTHQLELIENPAGSAGMRI